jgi:hypothetical protein
MNNRFLAVCIIVALLSALIPWGAAAGTSGSGKSSAGMSVTPDEKGKLVIWSPGISARLNDASDDNVTYVYHTFYGLIRFSSSNTTQLLCPLPVPARINGEDCKVTVVYLDWAGSVYNEITHVYVISGNEYLADMPVSSHPGTRETLTLDLGDMHAVPEGLAIAYDVRSSTVASTIIYVYGFGAKLRYKKT